MEIEYSNKKPFLEKESFGQKFDFFWPILGIAIGLINTFYFIFSQYESKYTKFE
jgi:hypothetical protein